MYNKVILMGRITHDLEIKSTPSGISVLSFSIAVERAHKSKDEERVTDFFNCVAWRNTAEFISRFFTKGNMILVEGELQTRKYTDKNNIERTVTEIIVSSSSFTGEKRQTGGAADTAGEAPPVPPTITAEDFANAPGDSDYPF